MCRSANNDGYVTLAVLLTAALLAAVVSALLAVSRPALGLVYIGVEQAAADALLDGGIAAAAYLLFQAGDDAAKVNGLAVNLDTGGFQLSVRDESGRVDINAASEELLAGLFARAGGQSMSPQAFAARLLDWRDRDSELHVGGAEANEYRDASLPYQPPNRPFASVAEMRFLLGLGSADFDRLKPFLTTYSGRGRIDPLSASPTVLAAVPGFTPDDVARILRAREQGLGRDDIVALVEVGSEFLSTEESDIYRVGVRVQLASGFADAVEAVIVAPEPRDTAPYGIAEWSRLTPGIGRQ